jgi:hypothetical protein
LCYFWLAFQSEIFERFSMRNRFDSTPASQIEIIGLADENTTARLLLECYADELRKLRSVMAHQIADDIVGIANKINEFHWQAPKTPWN